MFAAIPLFFALSAVPPNVAAPPSPPADGAPRVKAVKRSLASTTWPLEPSFVGGFVVSRDSFAPFVGAGLFYPVLPGIGPAVVVRVSGVQNGDLGVVEGVVGVGPAFETNLGDLRGRLTVAPGVLVSGYGYNDDSGVTVGPSVVVPLEAGLPIGGGTSFTLSIEPGVSRAVLHVANGEVAYSRDRVFVYVGAAINFGGP